MKHTHEVISKDLQYSYQMLTKACNLNTTLQARKKKDKEQIQRLEEAWKKTQESEKTKSKELSKLEKEHSKL